MFRAVLAFALSLLLFASQAWAGINVNAASQKELETLPGIGPAKATAIIEFRSSNGAFASLSDLDRVPGIGPATLANIGPMVEFGEGGAAAPAAASPSSSTSAPPPGPAPSTSTPRAPRSWSACRSARPRPPPSSATATQPPVRELQRPHPGDRRPEGDVASSRPCVRPTEPLSRGDAAGVLTSACRFGRAPPGGSPPLDPVLRAPAAGAPRPSGAAPKLGLDAGRPFFDSARTRSAGSCRTPPRATARCAMVARCSTSSMRSHACSKQPPTASRPCWSRRTTSACWSAARSPSSRAASPGSPKGTRGMVGPRVTTASARKGWGSSAPETARPSRAAGARGRRPDVGAGRVGRRMDLELGEARRVLEDRTLPIHHDEHSGETSLTDVGVAR